jgi:2-haloacid dehalogenase
MKKTLAFDVYGTLIDTHGVLVLLEEMVVNQALLFSQTWRTKQLEYSFRRGLMRCYQDFSICIKEALNYTCDALNLPLNNEQKEQLLARYKTLPAFNDVTKSLSQLSENHQLVAFSNGEQAAVESLLSHANIRQYFSDIITADEIKTFKPNPDIYQHLLTRTGSRIELSWLISSNSFDVIGAKSFGMKAAWVKRSSAAIYDPWGVEPDLVINNLDQLPHQLG